MKRKVYTAQEMREMEKNGETRPDFGAKEGAKDGNE